MFYKALQNCPWVKVSPKDRAICTCPRPFLPRCPPARVIPDRFTGSLSPVGPRLMGWCFMGALLQAGPITCPEFSPRAPSAAARGPALPCRGPSGIPKRACPVHQVPPPLERRGLARVHLLHPALELRGLPEAGAGARPSSDSQGEGGLASARLPALGAVPRRRGALPRGDAGGPGPDDGEGAAGAPAHGGAGASAGGLETGRDRGPAFQALSPALPEPGCTRRATRGCVLQELCF